MYHGLNGLIKHTRLSWLTFTEIHSEQFTMYEIVERRKCAAHEKL